MTSRGDMDYLLRHPQVNTRGAMDFQCDSTALVQRGARGIDYLTNLESLLHSLSASTTVEDDQRARNEATRARALRNRRARNLTCPTETQFNSARRATIATSEPLESMLPLARRSKCCDDCGSGVNGRWCAWRPPSVVVDLETLSAWAESLVAEVDHMCEEVLLAGTQEDQHESSAFPELGSSDKRQTGDEQVHAEGDGNTGPSPTPSSPLHPRDVEKFLQRVENSIRASSRSPPAVKIQKPLLDSGHMECLGPLERSEWAVSDNASEVFRDFGTQTSLDVSPSASCTWTSSDGERDVVHSTDSSSAGGLSHKGTQMNPSVESLNMMTSSAEALAPKDEEGPPRLKDEPTDSDSGSVSVSGPLDGLSAGRLSSYEQLDQDDGEEDEDEDDDEGEEEEEDVTVSGSPAGFEADDVLSSSSLRDSTPSPTVKADSGDSTAASDSLWHRRGPCDSSSGFQTVPKMRLKMAMSSNSQPVGSSQSGCSPFPLVRYDFGKASSAPVLDRRGSRHRQRNPGENCDGNSALLASSSSSSTSSSSSRRVNHAYYKDFTAPRYHSAKVLTELEAVEACKWLRAAGFPQYAQMFEDQHFPIEISSVQKDHYFLDEDSLQSLFRRLNALNRCAKMRLDGLPHKRHNEDSDDDEQCALSEHWKFQRHSRRWSRIPGFGIGPRSPDDEEEEEDEDASPPSSATPVSPPAALTIASTVALAAAPTELSCGSSYDSVLTDVFPRPSSSATSSPKPPPRLGRHPLKKASLDGTLGLGGEVDIGAAVLGLDLLAPPKDPDDQWGAEKKSGTKSILRRMGSLRSRRSKHKHKDLVVTVESEDPGNGDNAPRRSSLRLFNSGRSRSRTSETRGSRRGCALSDSECSPPPWRHGGGSGQDAPPLIEHFLSPRMPRGNRGSRSGSISAVGNTCGMLDGESSGTGVNHRTGSFNLGQAGNAYRERFLNKKPVESDEEPPTDFDRQNRGSIYDNMPIVIVNRGYQDNGEEEEDLEEAKPSRGRRPREQSSSNEGDSGSLTSTNQETGSEAETKGSREDVVQSPSSGERRDSGVGLSLSRIASGNNNKLSVHWHNAPQHRRRSSVPCRSLPINNLSVVQMLVLRKLALLKLTSLMEKYSPSNRSGWNWVMPKFIKRIKGPDYKDKAVFGVPLLVVLQRTGHPLPSCIQSAIRFLRRNSSEAVGIFRKSGVRSRIQKMKNYNEANPTNGNYEGQQTYDVADMLKQYFRELPEALLTTKFSETFISIYQYLAEEVRFEALQAAVILMPDENREVLQALLSFLRDVSSHASENQMTASNLAVCFAPSLFHMSNLRSQSMSPRRRKTVGVPDQKELNENRAAHECLTQMINDIDRIFSVPEEVMVHCSPPYVEQRDPPSLEELRQRCNGGNWSAYTEACTQWLSKESREKFKGWVSVATAENAELAYMKAADDQLLRWWKTSVEVEAPPSELLHRIIRDRHLWDDNLTKWQVVCCLDKCTEVFQYVCSSMPPLPAHDYCVFRSWRTDLPKNTCVLVEMSVDHLEAPPVPGAVRANVLGSRYLIEPCGSGKSRVTHVTRVDTKGRAPEWYIKAYGQMCALQMARLRESFRHSAEGPESKV